MLQSSNEEKLYMLETIVSNKININRQKIQIELDENINSLIELFQSHRLLSLFSILLKDRSVLDTKAEENRTHFPAIFVSKN